MPGDSPVIPANGSLDAPESSASKSGRSRLLVLDAVVGCAFAAVVVLVALLGSHQPLVADDYWLRLLAQQHPHGLDYLIYMYRNWSFSWPTYVLEQGFVASRLLFGVAKAAAFVALAGLSIAVARGRLPRLKRTDLYGIALLTCAYWFALPDLAETVSWSAGSAAYLWPTVAMLAFTLPIAAWLMAPERSPKGARGAVLRSVLMFATGLIAGSSHGQVVAMLGFLLVFTAGYALVRRIAGKVPWHLWAGAVGYAIGALILVSAPGNAVRAAMAGATNIGLLSRLGLLKSYYAAMALDYLPSVYPLLFGILIASVPSALWTTEAPDLSRTRFRGRGLVWVGCAIASTLPFVVLPAFGSARTAFIPAVLLVIATLSCLPEESSSGRRLAPSAAAAGVLVALLLVTSLSVYRADRSALALAAELRSREALIEGERAKGVRDLVVPRLTTPAAYGVFMIDIPSDPSKFDIYINETMAELYGLDSIRTGPTPKP